ARRPLEPVERGHWRELRLLLLREQALPAFLLGLLIGLVAEHVAEPVEARDRAHLCSHCPPRKKGWGRSYLPPPELMRLGGERRGRCPRRAAGTTHPVRCRPRTGTGTSGQSRRGSSRRSCRTGTRC